MMDTPRENSTHDSGVWLLDRIMNQMNAGVYITDVDTDEILFMNSGMKKQFGLVEPERPQNVTEFLFLVERF